MSADQGTEPELASCVSFDVDISLKLHDLFVKIKDVEVHGLSRPTFSSQVSGKLAEIFAKIIEVDDHKRVGSVNSGAFRETVWKYAGKIEELSRENFLGASITSLQEKISTMCSTLKQVYDLALEVTGRESWKSVLNDMNNLARKMVMASIHKVSSGIFETAESTLRNINKQIANIAEGQSMLERFYGAEEELVQAEALARHIRAAHTLVILCGSVHNALRKVKDGLCVPLRSRQVIVKPTKPVMVRVTPMDLIDRNVEVVLKSWDPRKRESFCRKFEEALQGMTVTYPPVDVIRSILEGLITVRSHDTRTKVFGKCSRMLQSISHMLEVYCQLKNAVVEGDSCMASFTAAIEHMTTYVEAFVKTRKKLQGWTSEKSKAFAKDAAVFLALAKNVAVGAKFAEQANRFLQKRVFAFDVSWFKLKPVGLRFATVSYPNKKDQMVTRLRAINIYQKAFTKLKRYNIDMTSLKPHIMHPPSLNAKCDGIRNLLRRLEVALMAMSGSRGSWEGSGDGHALDAFKLFDESIILRLEAIPMEIADLRLKSVFLYGQSFPIGNEDKLGCIFKELVSLYDYYCLLLSLDAMGAVSLTAAAHLTYLVTVCDALSVDCPIFEPFRDYFRSVDLFDVHMPSVTAQIKKLREVVQSELVEWNDIGFLARARECRQCIPNLVQFIGRNKMDECVDDFLTAVSSFLNDSPDLIQADIVRQIDIYMRVVKIWLLKYMDTNHQIKGADPVVEFMRLVTIFDEMRSFCELKALLDRLLSFTERVQVDETACESSESECDDGVSAFTETESLEFSGCFRDFSFTAHDFDFWYDAASVYARPHTSASTLESVRMENLSPELLYHQLNSLITVQCKEWWHNDARIERLVEVFRVKLESTDAPCTMEYLTSIFKDHSEAYGTLSGTVLDSVKRGLECFSEACHSVTTDWSTRHAREVIYIERIQRGVFKMKVALFDDNLSWYDEFAEVYKQLNRIVDDVSTFIGGLQLYLELSKLHQQGRVYVLLRRYFELFVHSVGMAHHDIGWMAMSLSYFFDKHNLLTDERLKDRSEIVVSSGIISDPCLCAQSMDIIRMSCSMINVKAIVAMCDSEFFKFDEFFSMFPTRLSSFERLLTSRLFGVAEEVRSSVFALLSRGSYKDAVTECLSSVHKLLMELDYSPFEIDNNPIHHVVLGIQAFRALLDTADTIDCVDITTPKTDGASVVSSVNMITIKIMFAALRSRLERLVYIQEGRFDKLFAGFKRVIAAISDIPNVFGLVCVDEHLNIGRLLDAWNDLCASIEPIELNEEHGTYSRIARSLITILRRNVTPDSKFNSDVSALELLVESYNLTHDSRILFRLMLSMMFFQNQSSRYIDSDSFSGVDFRELQETLTLLLMINEIEILFGSITEALNENFGCELEVPRIASDDTICSLGDMMSDGHVLDHRLTFEDQTALAWNVSVYAGANQVETERLAEMPKLEEDIRHMSARSELLSLNNEKYEELSDILSAWRSSTANTSRESLEQEAPSSLLKQQELEGSILMSRVNSASRRVNSVIKSMREIDTECLCRCATDEAWRIKRNHHVAHSAVARVLEPCEKMQKARKMLASLHSNQPNLK